MGDPRNVAHAKKVSQEKHKDKGTAKDGAPAPQSGKKAQLAKKEQTVPEERSVPKTSEAAQADQKPDAAKLEKSLTVLSKLKELEVYSAQDAFQSKILALIEAYEAECARLRPPG